MGKIRNDLSIYHDYSEAWWNEADPFFSPLRNLASIRWAYLRRIVPSFDGLEVLDVGCGGGYMMEPLAKAGAKVTGVDPALGALRAAQARARAQGYSLTTIRSKGERLPFGDSCFDVVLCTDVLVHAQRPHAVLDEVSRVLRSGGLFFFSAINRTWLARLVMITLAEDVLRWVHRGTHDPKRFIRPKELEASCVERGLEIIDFRGLMPGGYSFARGLSYRFAASKAMTYLGHARRRD